MNSKSLYYILLSIVLLEIIGAGISIGFASESTQRDAAISNMFLGVLAILLFSLPFLIESRFNIEIPSYLKIIVLLFLFASIVLGNIHGLLVDVNGYDKFLHVISGITISVIGFEIVHFISQAKGDSIQYSPGLVAIFAFSFSMTLLVLWEFYEFFIDTIAYHFDSETSRNMQRYQWDYQGSLFPQNYGLIDTMLDLLVGFVGAAVVSFIGWRMMLRKNISHHIKEKSQ
ncbi:hypothetical protein KHQ88_04770 [Mycoplasmatota bacterium]|nr:hypothetical protein KHQ88_04770 [Mycoplasmatota bacterium]